MKARASGRQEENEKRCQSARADNCSESSAWSPIYMHIRHGTRLAYCKPMAPLILKRAPIVWNQNDFDVLEDGVIVGRIFLSPGAPQDRPWMWASGHNGDIKRAAYGYEPT